jgi:predicted Zn-dependent protease
MPSDPLNDALKRGLHFHKLVELEQAETWYRAALAIDPDDAQVSSLLGLALVHGDRAEEGIPHLLRAVALEPEQLPFRFNLVHGLQHAGAHDRAMAELAVILKHEPSNFLAWDLAGDIAKAQGDRGGARKAWDRARQIDPSATGPPLKMARLEVQESRFDVALALLDPIATAAAANEEVYDVWCQALTGLGDWRALRATAASWVGCHPESAAARGCLERAELELGRGA